MNVPTQSALKGPNTTRPFEATAAPVNLLPVLSVELMDTQLKAFVAALNVPTQSATYGANTTRPFDATAAPLNLLPVLMVEDISRQLNGYADVQGTRLTTMMQMRPHEPMQWDVSVAAFQVTLACRASGRADAMNSSSDK